MIIPGQQWLLLSCSSFYLPLYLHLCTLVVLKPHGYDGILTPNLLLSEVTPSPSDYDCLYPATRFWKYELRIWDTDSFFNILVPGKEYLKAVIQRLPVYGKTPAIVRVPIQTQDSYF